MADIKDFTRRNRQTPTFRIADHVFFGVHALAAETGLALAARFGEMTSQTPPAEQVKALTQTLHELLQPESFTRFHALMGAVDDPNVVDLQQLEEIVTWLLEEYGLRPTTPSENLPPGSSNPETGTPLTDDALSGDSIP